MHRLKLASVPVGSDKRLADVDLAYATHGRLDADGGNCIVLPTYYTGNDESYLPWIGPGCPFDSDQWYVVVPNMIGNSRSTARDARTGRGWDPRTDPVIGIADNVAVQRRLLEHLGVQRVALVAGWSMGGLQAYEWAVAYPDLVDAILPICASARCWPLNAMFLQGVASFLEQALELSPGRRELGLAAFGRAYASWAFSGEYFRDELWRQDGFGSMDDLLTSWAEDHLSWNPADLLTMLRTWQHADPTRPGETLRETLGKVAARAIVMPSTTDMYFTLAENAIEVSWQPEAELRPIESAFGHMAGGPGYLPEVTAQVRQAVVDLLG
jgi:homoserine O-acetyltransferase